MFTEDLSAFFSVGEFATAGTLAGLGVAGIFDAAGNTSQVGDMGMASVAPTYTLPSASVPANPVGSALVIGAASYVVVQHLPDGTGVSTLLLEKSA